MSANWFLLLVVFIGGMGWGASLEQWRRERQDSRRVIISAPFDKAQAEEIMASAKRLVGWVEKQERGE